MNKLIHQQLVAVWLAVTLTCPALFAHDDPSEGKFSGATPLQWSVRMADSEIARRGDKLAWREGRDVKWDPAAGLFALSLLKLNQHVPTPAYVEFAKDAIGSFIKPDGSIHGYNMDEYNLQNIAPGRTVLALYQLTKEERYKKCAELLRKQLDTQPRTSEGGFWQEQRLPWQMRLNGAFAANPFYAGFTKLFNGPSADYDDVVKQFYVINAHFHDARSGLYFHGWDEKREQPWADKTTGLSSNFWGIAVGYYAMAAVDVLDNLPQNHADRAEIIATLKRVCDGAVRWQDADTGLWWQVMEKGGREGNHLEATCSAMFVYAMAKGVNEGYLDKATYAKAIESGYNGITRRLFKPGQKGDISLTRCSSDVELRNEGDGDFSSYIKLPVVYNSLQAVGAFILAGIEVQKVYGLPMDAEKGTGRFAATLPDPEKQSVAPEWKNVPDILARIKAPVFPDKDFPITVFGASADGKTDSSDAIAKAIDECHKAGGGRVVVSAGEFLTGPIHLKSGVNLHLDAGATLKFKTDPKAYLPAVRSWFEGMECYNYSPLIYAYGQENIAITGEGVLDGGANERSWWPWKGKTEFGWKTGTPKQDKARNRLIQMVEAGTPVEERQFGENDFLRPSFIEPFRCKNVLIEGVRIRRSPMWEIHPVLCTNVTVRAVEIVSHGPNNDGCDPEACRDVLIEDCIFDTGDDCIAIKSGRNNDGRRIGAPSENIIIRRCMMKDGHGGVTIGSEISGGARNIFVENCKMNSPHLDRAIRFKSNAVRGGVMENIFVRDIDVGTVADAALQIDFVYEEGPNGAHKPVLRNLVIENMKVQSAKRVLDVQGFQGSEIRGVRIHNSTFKGITKEDVVKEADVKLFECEVERK
ncbi:MAG: hypothetical protein HOP33_08870 [Verrucomicrobia bacterium]|nr:hypothetical protein [Verrucomicrobiota bacterium]